MALVKSIAVTVRTAPPSMRCVKRRPRLGSHLKVLKSSKTFDLTEQFEYDTFAI